ncbi:MAG: hypothetical protein FJY85_07075 [Deltaproteobacteria bacterium]|nr:hypothetical protein [Deltaproteobacteria bacterium]
MGIQNRATREKFSRLRQSLIELADQLRGVLEPLLSDQPLIKGTVYELKRKCGKPHCRCARGELHTRMVLSSSEQGRTRLRVVPPGTLIEVQIKVRHYQQFRRARARLGEIYKRMLNLVDQMEAMRKQEMRGQETSAGGRPPANRAGQKRNPRRAGQGPAPT